MAYPVVRQDGFQLPSPKSTDDDRDENMFHFAKFPNFADEIATLIETPHVPSHERSTFDIPYFAYDTPAPRSRSRSRPPSLGPTRSARPHVSSTSPPPRPHAIHIPGRGNPIGNFFVQNPASPDFLSYPPSSPYYAYQHINRPPTPTMPVQHIPKLPASAPSAPIKPLDPEVHLSEKRRRRRESHNAVERRRRDNINERIGELASLIPGVLFECDGPLVMPTDDLFALNEPVLHVMSEGLPDLPEESMVKRDPCEDGDSPTSPSTASAITVNGGTEQSTIKANKGVILRKSVEYIRYLQQLVAVQAARGRDLEERNRVLERELSILRGDSSSSSLASSQVLSSKPASEDLEMDDVLSERDESRGRQLARVRDKIHGMVL